MESAIANVDLGRYRRIVQMFWDPEPTNDQHTNQPVWCLGRSYQLAKSSNTIASAVDGHGKQPTEAEPVAKDVADPTATSAPARPSNDTKTSPESGSSSFSSSLAYDEYDQERGWPQKFLDDFESKLWMTYRSEFEPIAKSDDPKAVSALSLHMRLKNQLGESAGFSSDSGWGCMVRSGQSLLANAMLILQLGRDWRRGHVPEKERSLVSLFADDPRAPYSIHNFVGHGAKACGKFPGEWFGPSATASCIQALVNAREPTLRVYSTGDGPDVYEDGFFQVAQPGGEDFHPTLILVGTRLGIDKVTPVYWQALIASLQMSQSIGIAGGRPSSSHYFVGAQGDFLFYLDPHFTRQALPYHADPSQYTEEEVDSCHTNRLRRIHVREMDPSMLIGFLIRSKEDWDDWRRCVRHVQGKAIIHVSDRKPGYSGSAEGREGAIDEVQPLSDDDDAI